MKIIFLHGFPDNSKVWSQSLNTFVSRAQCVAPDIHSLSMREQYELLEKLASDSETVIIVAHDMGGPVAFEFASKNPQKVKKLILVNTMGLGMFAHRLRSLEQVIRSTYMSVFVNPLVNTFTLKKFAPQILNFIYNSAPLTCDDELRNNGPEVLDGLAHYKELLWLVPKKLFEPEEPLLVETHFIFGENDPFLLIPTAEELQRFFQQAKLHKLPTSHWPMRTLPKEFDALLSEIIFGAEK